MQSDSGLAVAGNSAQHIFARTVGNVFVHAQFGPLLLKQEFLIVRRQVERRLAEEKNLTALQHFAVSARMGTTLLGSGPARGTCEAVHRDPWQVPNCALLHLTFRRNRLLVAAGK